MTTREPTIGMIYKAVIWIATLLGAMMLAGTGCKDPNNGQSSANETPVPDGHVVLLKRTNEIAAFILRHQRGTPEVMDYEWYYRSDGVGTFGDGDSAVSTGHVTNAQKIAFATFSVEWSINTDGKGWVYFSTSPTQFKQAGDFLMCVTTETNLAGIDANATSWHYRERPSINLKALIESQVKDGP